MSEWVKVSDRLPIDFDVPYIVAFRSPETGLWHFDVEYCDEEDGFSWNRDWHQLPSVTHWMPIPSYPDDAG